MTREDVKQVVDALKKREMGILDMGNPTYIERDLHGLKEISLNILNPYMVIKAICEELYIED